MPSGLRSAWRGAGRKDDFLAVDDAVEQNARGPVARDEGVAAGDLGERDDDVLVEVVETHAKLLVGQQDSLCRSASELQRRPAQHAQHHRGAVNQTRLAKFQQQENRISAGVNLRE